MIKYLDIILRKLGLVRASRAEEAQRNSDAQIANLSARIHELKGFQAETLRCNAGNVVGMYG